MRLAIESKVLQASGLQGILLRPPNVYRRGGSKPDDWRTGQARLTSRVSRIRYAPHFQQMVAQPLVHKTVGLVVMPLYANEQRRRRKGRCQHAQRSGMIGWREQLGLRQIRR